MWKRHRLLLPFGLAAFVGMVLVAAWAGAEDWPTRIVIGLAGFAVAVAATTDYRVVAQTSEGILLLRASRIRQVAKEIIERFPFATPIEPVGGTALAADWSVAGQTYTVPRSSETAMDRIATRANT
jgi:hypothetical protein